MTFADGQSPIYNTEDYIDSRDVLARIEYLEGYDDLDGEGVAELKSLVTLTEDTMLPRDSLESGVTFIRESYFETAAKELADDMHADANLFGTRPTSWPFMHVDWAAAADSLRSDYSEIEFDGVTYLFQG